MEGRSVTQANPFLRNVSKYFLLACRACQQLLPMHLAELLLNVWVELLTYLLTHSRVQSPREANWIEASQEIPRISRNPKVHYRTHKRPPPVSILDRPNPVHIPTSHLLEIHSNIIHPSTPRSPQWSPSLQFPHQDPIHPPLLTHTCHMPSPSHWVELQRVNSPSTFDYCERSFRNPCFVCK